METAINDIQFLIGAIVQQTKNQIELTTHYREQSVSLEKKNLENRGKYEKARQFICVQDRRIFVLKKVYEIACKIKFCYPPSMSKRLHKTVESTKRELDKLKNSYLGE